MKIVSVVIVDYAGVINIPCYLSMDWGYSSTCHQNAAFKNPPKNILRDESQSI